MSSPASHNYQHHHYHENDIELGNKRQTKSAGNSSRPSMTDDDEVDEEADENDVANYLNNSSNAAVASSASTDSTIDMQPVLSPEDKRKLRQNRIRYGKCVYMCVCICVCVWATV